MHGLESQRCQLDQLTDLEALEAQICVPDLPEQVQDNICMTAACGIHHAGPGWARPATNLAEAPLIQGCLGFQKRWPMHW